MERDLGEEKMRQNGFSRKRRQVEESRSRTAQPSGFEIAAFLEEQQTLVQVNKPGPNQIVFAHKDLASLCKALQRLHGFSLLAVSGGLIGKSLRRLVTHTQLLETKKAFVGHLARLFA